MPIYVALQSHMAKPGTSSEQKQPFTQKVLSFMNNQIYCLCWKRGFLKGDESFEILIAVNRFMGC
jgi:hypothetical protein